MPASINSKDIPRHAALLQSKADTKVAKEAAATRRAGVQAMKTTFNNGRSGNPQGPLTGPEKDALLRIVAAEKGLVEPD